MFLISSINRLRVKYKLHNKIKRIDKRTESRIDSTKLDSSQLKSITDFWNPFVAIRPSAHTFYYEKTGVFSPHYIPDSIHIYLIDQYFNDWNRARYLDNKCYYPRMFYGVRMPKMIAYRMNGIWYDGQNRALGGGRSCIRQSNELQRLFH